jgi:ankyrin repeat protein
VKLLLDKSADVNAPGGEYGNALQAASLRGRAQVMMLLPDKGADVNAQGGEYGNALQAALVEGHEQVVKLLLDKGGNVNVEGLGLTSLPASRKTPHSEKNAGYFDFESLNSHAHTSNSCRNYVPEYSS